MEWLGVQGLQILPQQGWPCSVLRRQVVSSRFCVTIASITKDSHLTWTFMKKLHHVHTLIHLQLDRYKLSGKVMPGLKDWMVKTVGVDITHTTPAQVPASCSLTTAVCFIIFSCHFIFVIHTHSQNCKKKTYQPRW